MFLHQIAHGVGDLFPHIAGNFAAGMAGGIQTDGQIEGNLHPFGGSDQMAENLFGSIASGPGVDGESVDSSPHGAPDLQFRAFVRREVAFLRSQSKVGEASADPVHHASPVMTHAGGVLAHVNLNGSVSGGEAAHVVGKNRFFRGDPSRGQKGQRECCENPFHQESFLFNRLNDYLMGE